MQHSPLHLENVSVKFGKHLAINDISINIPQGSVVGIAGPNGSGKTTLLRTMFGAQPVTEGRVLVYGQPIKKLRAAQIARRISVVSQFETDMDRMRVRDIVLLGRAPHRKDVQGYSKEDHQIAKQSLVEVRMQGTEDRYIDTLSGGERQRILIARSLTQQSECMLLDEPTNHLDVKYQHQILNLVRSIATTAVVVLHDLNLVARYCDQAIILKEGRLYCVGCPNEILNPELIRDVYGVDATEISDDGSKQFIFKTSAENCQSAAEA